MVNVAIKAVVFDLGGILEIIPGGNDPTSRFPAMLARWDERMGWPPGAMAAKFEAQDERHRAAGKDNMLGGFTYEEWLVETQVDMGWDAATRDAFFVDYWDNYIGDPNPELADYFVSLRPRYRTAFLSNSGIGAREHEQAARGFEDMADLIIYSHEVGVAKPDPRIYAITCERLGVQPPELVFLDNVSANIASARDFGIHGVVFQDNTQAIREINALLAAHAS
ncbi:MAG TPA: HAD family phosphatase [Ktedonobacterales bacterium]